MMDCDIIIIHTYGRVVNYHRVTEEKCSSIVVILHLYVCAHERERERSVNQHHYIALQYNVQ